MAQHHLLPRLHPQVRANAFFLFLLLLPAVSVAQSNPLLTGRWRVHGWIDGNDLESECTFTQNGQRLRGTCTSEQGPTEISGQVKDSTVLWTYVAEYDGTSSPFRYTGTLTSRRIVGKIIVEPNMANGEFVATPVR